MSMSALLNPIAQYTCSVCHSPASFLLYCNQRFKQARWCARAVLRETQPPAGTGGAAHKMATVHVKPLTHNSRQAAVASWRFNPTCYW